MITIDVIALFLITITVIRVFIITITVAYVHFMIANNIRESFCMLIYLIILFCVITNKTMVIFLSVFAVVITFTLVVLFHDYDKH